tara:strand:+ start:467 stop:727 length:261 start_codon:yes stop_codon:yes gene_type:complete
MLGKTATFYKKNKESRDKKAKYDKKFNKLKSQIKKRVELAKIRRRAKKNGKNIDGKDYDHAVGRFVNSSTNRGRKYGTKGDRNARG